MRTTLLNRLFTLSILFACAVGAARAETTLLLDIGWGIRFVPPSRVTVPAGEYLTVVAPSQMGSVQWMKNDHPLHGQTSHRLILQEVRRSDAGIYTAIDTSNDSGWKGSQALHLRVGPPQRLVNLSTRARIGEGDDTFIAGFAVTGDSEKKIIIRAIGPSLAQFGVSDPVSHPAIAVFDSHGQPYTNAYVYPAVEGGLTYEKDLADSLLKCGAFPLPAGSDDVVALRPFAPGGYTVHVTSADGTPGVVLLEIYEVP